jgi:hypothetical protein
MQKLILPGGGECHYEIQALPTAGGVMVWISAPTFRVSFSLLATEADAIGRRLIDAAGVAPPKR